jgi:mannan endo-1,4-beta-mannosidase
MPTSSQSPEPVSDGDNRRAQVRLAAAICLAACAIAVLTLAIVVAFATHSRRGQPEPSGAVRYLGVYEPDAPSSYAGVEEFAQAIGRQPNLVAYYSSWLEPFQVSFASSATKHGATTLVQIDTGNLSLASVAKGQYDSYLKSFASEVKTFGAPVILSFDHEMNGNWYSWGYRHSSPREFISAWRHVVTIFREQGARNVTWMWTINIFNSSNLLSHHVAAPGPWWPGGSYVNWVGLDGYYVTPSDSFDSLFGPAIAAVRGITPDPILVAETGATESVGQSAKITQIFGGVNTYGLLGFVLFDKDGAKESYTWRITDPSVYATLKRDAQIFIGPPSRTVP